MVTGFMKGSRGCFQWQTIESIKSDGQWHDYYSYPITFNNAAFSGVAISKSRDFIMAAYFDTSVCGFSARCITDLTRPTFDVDFYYIAIGY